MTHLFLALTAAAPDPDTAATLLAPRLFAGCEKKRDPRALREGLAVRLLLQCALAMLCPDLSPRLTISEGGRPFLCDCPLFVSLSHSRDRLAVALSETPCGVDVEDEAAVRDPKALARRFLPPEEAAAIAASSDPALCFLSAFTLREAALKRGDGDTLCRMMAQPPPPGFSRVLCLPDGRRSVLSAVGEGPYAITECTLPG